MSLFGKLIRYRISTHAAVQIFLGNDTLDQWRSQDLVVVGALKGKTWRGVSTLHGKGSGKGHTDFWCVNGVFWCIFGTIF